MIMLALSETWAFGERLEGVLHLGGTYSKNHGWASGTLMMDIVF